MAADPERIREVVNRYVELVGSGTSEEIVALYAEGATVEDPVGSEVLSDRDGIRAFYAGLDGLEKDTRLVTVRIAGGAAAFHFEVGTHVGEQTYTVTPIDVMTFDDDGLITSMKAFWGDADMVSA
ncbi:MULTISPECIES: nuclear transport factor 2 family protein [unclassified Nocardioides]|uniref:nuclear transport factor 2 family protein n=1 Tax=unclassified Nocardioides TaxID=2615069 RepID=UPI0009F0067A|nr:MULTISPECIES: nuclear transport factor 2 family protein [unclassified Nocardioides]GAW50739.1 nuclear transport factor 2 [Nocardioides sp. PD653-B2]GAW55478.1 nuclear transport factor 2 [Nocardioides sp. PD653]